MVLQDADLGEKILFKNVRESVRITLRHISWYGNNEERYYYLQMAYICYCSVVQLKQPIFNMKYLFTSVPFSTPSSRII